MRKKLMILGAGLLQIPLIRSAKELGLEVLVADMNPDAIGFSEDGIKRFVVSTTDTAGILEVARKEKVDGILTAASDVPMPTVAAVCEDLGLHGISKQCALRCTNKAEMRKCLSESGVPIPRFIVVSSVDDAISAGKEFNGKIVVKASDNSGNRGISMVDDGGDINGLETAFQYALQNSRDKRVLIEEYMDGEEFSVEGMSINGVYQAVQVTDKITNGSPYFVEMGHTQPSAQPKEILDSIIQVASEAAKALGITDGPSHTEIKLTSNGPKIVEVGARLGGGCITSHLVPLSTGVDMVKSAILVSLGETPDIHHRITKGAAIRFFDSHKGVISKIDNIEMVLSMPGVKEVSFFKTIGDSVNDLKTGLDRVGYVIAQGENRESAIKNCEAAMEQVKITLS